MSVLRQMAMGGLIALACAGAAAAQNCVNPQTQVDMNQCANLAAQAADAELNAAYGQAMAVARQDGTDALLRDAQRKWVPYRDAACQAESAGFSGGSIMPLMHFKCLERLTRQRTGDLYIFARP
ncbi:lysozyme inhibitor LprI family protein [Pseudooceanicola sp. C21-150M6]|uniref:lysozyme inhibitor LprI family protein n=1 Tax=Pseudooceanicola sp. C21-150M6 TaxID=3434355 RepID=UPI003D7F7A5F